MPSVPTCPVIVDTLQPCGYVGQGATRKEQLTDLFRHQQAVHVDPLKVKP